MDSITSERSLKRGVLVFDLDDTLFAESDYVRSGMEAVGRWLEKERGIRGLGKVAIAVYERGVRGTIFDVALEEMGVKFASRIIPEMVHVYRTHAPAISMGADTIALLDTLRTKLHLCLITDGPLTSQLAKIKALGLEKWFESIRCTDEWGREFWKPNSRAYEEVCAKFPMPSQSQYIYVGDNPTKDFIAPRKLGWHTTRLIRNGGTYENAFAPSPNAEAEHEISSLDELPDYLEFLGLLGVSGT